MSSKEYRRQFELADKGHWQLFPDLMLSSRTLYAPILFFSSRTLTDELHADSLIEVARSLQCRGIATRFLKSFGTLLRNCGFLFYGSGHEDEYAANFFVMSGRRFLEEMIDTSRFKALVDDAGDRDRTASIKFLYEVDEEQFVRPELLHADLDSRLDLLHRISRAKTLFGEMNAACALTKYSATTCEILEDMQRKGVPVEGDFAALDCEAIETLSVLRNQCIELWDHAYDVAARYSDDDIDEFIGWYR